MYRTRDGYFVTLVASSQATFARLCEAMGQLQWLSDPRFANNVARVQHLAELDDGVVAWFTQRDYEQVEKALGDTGIPFTKVYSIEDIEQDPQYRAREAIIRLPDTDYGTLPAPCIVPRIPGREMPIPRTGPSVGEHNAEVYAEFGISASDLDLLRAQGVI
jgi:crotonobetainyl-CoA:carnitine CoA-transferase CaiB-like acyl-CoA transferase